MVHPGGRRMIPVLDLEHIEVDIQLDREDHHPVLLDTFLEALLGFAASLLILVVHPSLRKEVVHHEPCVVVVFERAFVPCPSSEDIVRKNKDLDRPYPLGLLPLVYP